MIRVLINGCNGRMGRVITRLVAEQENMQTVAGVDITGEQLSDFPVFAKIDECNVEADVIIDFSHFSAVPAVIDYALKTNTALVVATTGLEDSTIDKLHEAAKTIPVFRSANMSLGVNLIANASALIAQTVDGDFNAEIVEKHHNKKLDSPSGTAILLADKIRDASKNEKTYSYGRHSKHDEFDINNITIHAVRGGTIPGEHSVYFIGPDEIIEIKHTALSRDIFGHGAVKAAAFTVAQKPGRLLNMDDMIN